MIRGRKFYQLLIILLVLVLLWAGAKKFFTGSDWSKLTDHQFVRVQIDNQQYKVEIANTSASLSLGLGERSEIGSDGMLFVLPHKQRARFWMKDMKFPLDFVWIADGRVRGVTENVLPPASLMASENLPVYSSPGPVDLVLELNAGMVATQQIKINSSVKLLP